IKQTIVVPDGSSTLSFWYNPATTDSIYYDWQQAQIQDTSGNVLAQIFRVADNSQTWKQASFDLTPYAGQTIVLYFKVHQDGFGDLTSMLVDDVTVSRAVLTMSQAVNVAEGDVLTGNGLSISSAIVNETFYGAVANFSDANTAANASDFTAT